MIKPQSLAVLVELRRQAGLSQSDMAQWCGLHGRRSHQTAGAWERGDYAPDQRRRLDFIHYLWDGLGLRRAPERFEEVWTLLCAAWGWDAIGDEEWRSFTSQPRPSWNLAPAQPQRAPFQAPQLTGPFLGRQQETARLQTVLTADPVVRVVALTGMGGIGKTTLATRTAHDLRAQFADGVLWGNPAISDPAAILDSWGQAFDYDFSRLSDVASKAAAFRDLVAGKRLLIVLDNANSAETATPLLPGSPSCAVLITTRNQEVAHALHAEVIPLTALQAEASLALLTQIVGQERIAHEQGAAAEICVLLDHLPLAVEIAGQRLRARPERGVADFAERLRSVQTVLSELRISDRAVRTSFETSWQALDDDLRCGFAQLALFEVRPFDMDAFAAVCGLDRYDAEEMIFSFVALSLLIDNGQQRYRLHPLLAEFAREKFERVANADELWLRFARYFCRLAQSQAADLPVAAPEWDHIVAGMAAAHRLDMHTLVIDYARALTDPWRRQGRFTQARQGYGLATEAAGAAGDLKSTAGFLHEWSFACLEQDDYGAATPLLAEAVALFTNLEDEKGLADTQLLQARMAVEQDDYAKAEAILRTCWAIFAGMDEGSGLARTLYWQGLVYYYQGRHDEAKTLYSQACSLQETLDEKIDLIATLRALADIAIEEKAYAEAEKLCARALEGAVELADHGEQAAVLYLLAVVADCQQRWDEALTHAAEALDHFERIGDRGFQALTLYQQSQIYLKLGDYSQAEALILRSRRLVEALEQKYMLVFILHNLGRIYAASGRHHEARTAFRDALQRAEASAHPLVERLRQQLAELG
jgi:predicted ATPase/DNA-binding XRE family transcriptional regulator